jgi:uncharacterized protein (DUF362 family)
MSKVAIIHHLEASEAPYRFTDRGLQALKTSLEQLLSYPNWDSSKVKGKSILLKPNLVRPHPDANPAITTDPRVILALIDLFRQWGAVEVAVGDNPGYGLPARKAFELAKLDTWIPEHGGVIVPFDEEPPLEIDNPNAIVFPHVLLPPAARRYDLIVNLPKLKTHMHTVVSLGIKNLYGFVTDAQRLDHHRNDLHRKLVEFLYILKPDITIIDGLWALEGQAPLYGNAVQDMGVLIAGEDIVAVDAVGSSMMGIDPGEVTTTRLAHLEGFGTMDLNAIDIRGVPMAEVRRPFKRAVLSSVGIYPTIKVVEGGGCIGCQSALRHSLDRLAHEGKFRPGTDTVFIGRYPPINNLLSLESSDIWCYGDCTEELYLKLRDNGNVVWISGCAPHCFDLYLAYLGQPIKGERPHYKEDYS